jgi:Domain of unknown function (DUF4402)
MANSSLIRRAVIAAAAASLAATASPVAAQCRLCAAAPAAAKPPATAISISIETAIDFSRIGLITANQGGTATIDPVTGQRIVSGSLLDLSGLPVQGTVTIRGQRNELVMVQLPPQVTLTNAGGGTLRLSAITTDLKNNTKLDKDGLLRFTFGGRLEIDGNSDGDFRGRVPITVEYR